MSNINKINGLDIDAASAQYVAAGNVDGPLGYNSVQNAVTASYLAGGVGATEINEYSLRTINPIPGGIGASTTYAIYLGYNAGGNATGAQYSNMIGYTAGTYAANASFANFIGINAGYEASEANNSNFIGVSAGDGAWSASYANFIGFSAGAYARDAIYSNFIGIQSGMGARFANSSNFIGNSAGYYAQSASYSVLIGYKAGANYSPFSGSTSIGNNNIIIGTNITLPGGARDSINIGGILFGTGSYRAVSGNALSGSVGGRIGINVVSPTYNFQVSGSVAFTNLTTANQSNVVTIDTATGRLYYTASSAFGGAAATSSWAVDAVHSVTAQTASYLNTLNQNVTINGNLSVFGTASYTFVSSSQLNVGTNTISVNVAEPAQRFGGLIVYDSGSISHQATSSFLWDSLNNKWIYQNVSGSGYDGGMAIFGPRNLSGLGNEQGTTNNALMKGQGGDHITSSRIFDDGTNVYTNSDVQITGSLTVTGNVIATASWASNTITAQSSSINYLTDAGTYPLVYVNGTGNQPLNISPYGALYNTTTNSISSISSITASSGFQGTASYAIQALTASYAMNGGGGGGVTSITAGDGISVDQSTGAVTITNTGGGGGGTNLGLVYAVSLGYLMP
jgi:hypothetical protein